MADEAAAKEYFSVHALYPSVRVRLFDWETRFSDPLPRQGPDRLKDLIEIVDAHAGAYLSMVSDRESQKEYEKILAGTKARALTVYIGIHPDLLFLGDPPEWQVAINQRIRYWINEGYKRLVPADSGNDEESPNRHGYKDEIDKWMSREGLKNLEVAARRLAVSVDVLKSIRSSKGRARHSDQTLNDVLEKTGIKRK
jgi:hypothetical protein